MNRVTAENLLAGYRRITDSCNAATVLVGSLRDPDEQQHLRRLSGSMMQSV